MSTSNERSIVGPMGWMCLQGIRIAEYVNRRSLPWFGIGIITFLAIWIGAAWRYTLSSYSADDWPTALLRSAQLFVLNSQTDQHGAKDMILLPMRFLAPLFTIAGVLAAVRARIGQWARRQIVRSARNHVVVCGLGAKGLAVAEAVFQEVPGRHPIVIAIERDPASREAVLYESGFHERGLIVAGDFTDAAVRMEAGVQHAREVYVCGNDDLENVGVQNALRHQFHSRKGTVPTVMSHVRHMEPTVNSRMPVEDEALGNFSMGDAAAKLLLMEWPAFCLNEEGILRPRQIAIVDTSPLSERLLLEIGAMWSVEMERERALQEMHARAAYPADAPSPRRLGPMVVHLIGRDTRPWFNSLKLQNKERPWLSSLEPVFVDVDPAKLGSPIEELRAFQTYYCPDNTQDAFRTVMLLHRAMPRSKIVCATWQKNRIEDAIQAFNRRYRSDVRAFGLLGRPSPKTIILGRAMRNAAESIHETIWQKGSWQDASPLDQWESEAAVLRFPANLASSRLRLQRSNSLDDEGSQQDLLARHSECLALREHERWRRSRVAQGLRYGLSRTDTERPELAPWRSKEPGNDLDGFWDQNVRTFTDANAYPRVLADLGLRVVRANRRRN